jgi:hypothetical protein
MPTGRGFDRPYLIDTLQERAVERRPLNKGRGGSGFVTINPGDGPQGGLFPLRVNCVGSTANAVLPVSAQQPTCRVFILTTLRSHNFETTNTCRQRLWSILRAPCIGSVTLPRARHPLCPTDS